MRGGLSLGIPIAQNHGLTIGLGVSQIFSDRELLRDPDDLPDGETTLPFDLWVDGLVGYQIWF